MDVSGDAGSLRMAAVGDSRFLRVGVLRDPGSLTAVEVEGKSRVLGEGDGDGQVSVVLYWCIKKSARRRVRNSGGLRTG